MAAYSTHRAQDGARVFVEEDSRAWRAMEEFSRRFPRGDESEWDSFVVKHANIQRAELSDARERLNDQ